MPVVVQYTAVDKGSGLTLGELRAFLEEATKMEIPIDTAVRVRIGFSQQIQRISTERI